MLVEAVATREELVYNPIFPFPHLPYEILLQLLKPLSSKDVELLTLVCKGFCSWVNSTVTHLTFQPSASWEHVKPKSLAGRYPRVNDVTIDLEPRPNLQDDFAGMSSLLTALTDSTVQLLPQLANLKLNLSHDVPSSLHPLLANLLQRCNKLQSIDLRVVQVKRQQDENGGAGKHNILHLTMTKQPGTDSLKHHQDLFNQGGLHPAAFLQSAACRHNLHGFDCHIDGQSNPFPLALLSGIPSLKELILSPCPSVPSLSQLTGLTQLKLYSPDANVHTILVHVATALTNLKTLECYNTDRSTQDAAADAPQIPTIWAQPQLLENLTVHLACISYEDLEQLTSLRRLQLGYGKCVPSPVGNTNRVPTCFNNLTRLAIYELNNAPPVSTMPWQHMTHLMHLSLHGYDQELDALPSPLPPCITCIKVTVTPWQHLDGPVLTVPESWSSLVSLRKFGLNASLVDDSRLLSFLSRLPSLESLEVPGLRFDVLAGEVPRLCQLTRLQVCGDVNSSPHWQALVEVGSLRKLEMRDLSEWPHQLPRSLTSLHLSGSFSEDVPASVFSCTKLVFLNVMIPNLSCHSLQAVTALTSLKVLQAWWLDSGCVGFLDSLTQLTKLIVSANRHQKMEGKWPALQKANRLQRVSVSGFDEPPMPQLVLESADAKRWSYTYGG